MKHHLALPSVSAASIAMLEKQWLKRKVQPLMTNWLSPSQSNPAY